LASAGGITFGGSADLWKVLMFVVPSGEKELMYVVYMCQKS